MAGKPNNTQYEYFVFSSGSAPAVDSVWTKIMNFGLLKNGWDLGEGYASTPETVSKALTIYSYGKIYDLEADAFPGMNGGINVIFYKDDHALEIRVRRDGRLDLVYEVGIGVEFDTIESICNIDIQTILNKLATLAGSQESAWKSFARLIWQGTTSENNDLILIPSTTRTTISVFNRACAERTSSGGICGHIKQFYMNAVEDIPCAYWIIETDESQELCGHQSPLRLISNRSDSGDDCHYDIEGATNSDAERFSKANCKPPRVFICYDHGVVPGTAEELTNLKNMLGM